MNSINSHNPNFQEVLVYSHYQKLQKDEVVDFSSEYKENTEIEAETVIGEMISKMENNIKTVISPYKGVIIHLASLLSYNGVSNKNQIVARVKLCPISYSSEYLLIRKAPHKLPQNLEILYYFSSNENPNSEIKILKSKGIINRIYTKGEEFLVLEHLNKVYKITAPVSGALTWIRSLEGFLSIKDPLFSMNPCKHPEAFQGLCTNCSEKILSNDDIKGNSHLLVKTVTILGEDEKKRYALEEKQSFINKRKLILILDLDNTLIHAVKVSRNFSNKSLEEDKDVYIWLINSSEKFLIKLRPYLQDFFEEIKNDYTIFLYTSGTRNYAEYNCFILKSKGANIEPDKLIALEDNFMALEKKISRLLPHLHEIVLILDDNANVWPEDQKNLIYTEKFEFFPDEKKMKDQEDFHSKYNDNYLYFTRKTLHKISKIFFSLKDLGKNPDVREIYSFLKRNMLSGIKIAFSGLVNKAIPFMENPWVKVCCDHGAKVIENFDENSEEKPDILLYGNLENIKEETSEGKKDILFNYKELVRTHKVNLAFKLKIPVVHFQWLINCRIYSNLVVWNTFKINKEVGILLNSDVQRKLVEDNKVFLENNEEKIINKAVEILKNSC